jgi:hypothetical protein
LRQRVRGEVVAGHVLEVLLVLLAQFLEAGRVNLRVDLCANLLLQGVEDDFEVVFGELRVVAG